MTAQILKGSPNILLNGLAAGRVGDLTSGVSAADVATSVASGVAGALSNITNPLQFAAGAAISAASGVLSLGAGGLASVASIANTGMNLAVPLTLPAAPTQSPQAASKGYVDALVANTVTSITPTGPAGGDLSGTYPNPTVAKLNGVAANGYARLTGAVFTGAVSANNLSGTNTGDQTSVSGNAGTATKLATPRNINGVAFDGSANIQIGQLDAVNVAGVSSGTMTVNCAADCSTVTLAANITTVSFTNLQASGSPTFVIMKITQGTGTYTITWPSAVKWKGGTAYVPSTASGAVDTVGLVTFDAGTTWQGVYNKAFA